MNLLFSSKIYTRLSHKFPFSWKSNVSAHLHGKQPFSTLGLTQDSDTIYALCSGPLVKSGVGVIRVSGPNAFDCIQKMTNSSLPFPEFRKATYRSIFNSQSKELIDKGLIICFQEGSSYTAEKVVEFHVHGSPAVLSAVLHSLSLLPSFRLATPGEFTKRAFMNGKMSFLEVEALGDLLNAETEKQRQQAMHGMNGELNKLCWKWRDELMKCLASAETIIDFSDDVDDENALLVDSHHQLQSIQDEMKKLISSFDYSQLIKEGINITLMGPPNAGKSSLMNQLVGSEFAIVSSIPGTTRDILTVDMDLDGYKVILHDTAGIHDTEDIIEKEGIKRAFQAVKKSQICVVLVDMTSDYMKSLEMLLKSIKDDQQVIVVLNKKDLISDASSIHQIEQQIHSHFPSIQYISSISCLQKEDISSLLHNLSNLVQKQMKEYSFEDTGIITRERQRNCLEQCISYLSNCIELQKEDLVDLQAEELRNCLRSLGQLTGDVDIEEVLDIVFSDFCIGK